MASMGAETIRNEEGGEWRKLSSLFRLVRSSSRVRIRSSPISVLPVRKSALMLSAGGLACPLLASLHIALRRSFHIAQFFVAAAPPETAHNLKTHSAF